MATIVTCEIGHSAKYYQVVYDEKLCVLLYLFHLKMWLSIQQWNCYKMLNSKTLGNFIKNPNP